MLRSPTRIGGPVTQRGTDHRGATRLVAGLASRAGAALVSRLLLVLAVVLAAAAFTVPASASVPASAAAPSQQAAVPGLQRVTATSAFNSVSPKSATAICPVGKRVIGTGFEITGGLGKVLVTRVLPTASSVRVDAVETDPIARNWLVRSFAICANPLPGLQLVRATSAFNSVSPKSATAICPAGKRVTGVGGAVLGGGGQVGMTRIAPTDGTLRSVRVTAFEADPTALNWSVQAFAICANPLPGRQLVTATSLFNSVSPKSATATCPAGKRVTGTGAEIIGGGGQIVINNMTPDITLRSVRATGFEEDPTQANWAVRSFAICATP